MSYYEKYLKYKNKYLILQSNIKNLKLFSEDDFDKNNFQENDNQIGGYNMSDIRPTKEGNDSLLTIILNFITQMNPLDKNLIQTIFKNDPRIDLSVNLDKLITLFESQQYIDLYSTLFDLYTNMVEYDNRTLISDTLIDEEVSIYPYHINIGALILINYLIELECFCLMYSILQYNVVERDGTLTKKNRLATITWVTRTNTTLSYKKIDLPLSDIFTQLTTTVDTIFTYFMDNFINNINRTFDNSLFYGIDRIKTIILNSKKGESEYAHIYIDWKNRLIKYILERSVELKKLNMSNRTYNYRECNHTIKKAIQDALYIISNTTPYSPEADGFFSYMYLINNTGKTLLNYGSCITYSIIEMYIMSRLHIDMKNINLELESAHPYTIHAVWQFTQNKLEEELRDPINKKERSITHWTSKYFNTDTIKMREVYPDRKGKGAVIKTFNLKDNKKQIFKAVNYCIYDSFIEYIQLNQWSIPEYYNNLLLINKINSFFRKRIDFWETKCSIIVPNIPELEYVKIKVPYIFGFNYFIDKKDGQGVKSYYTSYDDKTNITINTEYDKFIEIGIPYEIIVNYKIKDGFRQGVLETHSINFNTNKIKNESRFVTTHQIINYTLVYKKYEDRNNNLARWLPMKNDISPSTKKQDKPSVSQTKSSTSGTNKDNSFSYSNNRDAKRKFPYNKVTNASINKAITDKTPSVTVKLDNEEHIITFYNESQLKSPNNIGTIRIILPKSIDKGELYKN